MQTVPAPPSAADEKGRLRLELRASRRALDAARRSAAAAALATAARDVVCLAAARAVVGYASSDGEIDVAAVLEAARARGAEILLPRRVREGVLELADAFPGIPLVPTGPAGILEPTGPARDPTEVATPAVLLAPALGIDRRGYRLGRGGGDYDRLIPRLRALGWTIVGVCHAAQVRDAVPVEAHDQVVDLLLTDGGTIVPQGRSPAPPWWRPPGRADR